MSNEFRYRRLGYLTLEVKDIEASTRFAVDILGLELVDEGADGARFFRVAAGHHDLIMTPASAAGLVRSSWEVESHQELDAAYAHFVATGLDPAWVDKSECDRLYISRAFRIVDPVIGAKWEYFAEMTQICTPPRNPVTSFVGGKHYGLYVPDNRSLTRLLCDRMGFILSDYIGDEVISLLRAWPNPNHHSIGTVAMPGVPPRLHHIAFMVKEIDDIGRLFNRCKNGDVEIQFGIGRHPTSGSIHLYIYGPENFVWEYTLGMEQFPEVNPRSQRRMSSAPEHYDLWGAIPDDSRAGILPPVQVSAEVAGRSSESL
jgi:2,3-dihydroxy-p-cumate/2,3-dihydroxybenzoate 3,4-dioxygenase